MNNIPDVHEFDIEIPSGKVRIAECRQLGANDRRKTRVVLDSRKAWNGRTTIELVACFAGWTPAGSAMRWDNGSFAVLWNAGGSTGGAHYKTFDAALDHFNRIPA